MTNASFPKDIEATSKKCKKPHFIVYGCEGEDGELSMNIIMAKVSLKTVVQALLHIIDSIVDQTMK